MPEAEETQKVRLVVDEDFELRWPDGHIVDNWEALPGGGTVQLRRSERQQYSLGGGTESWTLEVKDASSHLHQQDMGEFHPGQAYMVGPEGIQKLEPEV